MLINGQPLVQFSSAQSMDSIDLDQMSWMGDKNYSIQYHPHLFPNASINSNFMDQGVYTTVGDGESGDGDSMYFE